jgi:hypothetical protein
MGRDLIIYIYTVVLEPTSKLLHSANASKLFFFAPLGVCCMLLKLFVLLPLLLEKYAALGGAGSS